MDTRTAEVIVRIYRFLLDAPDGERRKREEEARKLKEFCDSFSKAPAGAARAYLDRKR